MRISLAILLFPWSLPLADAQKPFTPAQLDGSQIPAEERAAGQPKELVAVVGSQLGRHWSALACLSHSPDGKYLACGSDNGAVCIWDAVTLQPVATIAGHKRRRVYAVAFSPNSQILASAAGFPDDGEVRLWDVSTGKLRETVTGKVGHFWARAFAFDGERLLSAGEDQIVRLWDVTKTPARLQAEHRGHEQHVNAVAFGPEGKTALSGDAGGTLRVWDVQTGKPLSSQKVSESRVVGLVVRDKSKSLLVGSDKVVRVFDWQAGKPSKSGALKHESDLVYMALSRDEKRLATVCSDATVHLWDMTAQPPKEVATWERLSDRFPGEFYYHKVAFAPDGKTLSAIGGWSHAVRQWDVSGAVPRERVFQPGPQRNIVFLAWAPDGRVIGASEDNMGWIWDWTGKSFGAGEGWSLEGDRYGWDPLALTDDRKTMAAASWEYIQLWDLDVRPPRASVKIPDPQSKEALKWSALAFAPNGKTLAAANRFDERIRLIDFSGKKQRESRIETSCGRPEAIVYSPDGRTLAVGGDAVEVYELASGTLRWSLKPSKESKNWVRAMCFSPDRKSFAVQGNGTVTLVKVASPKERTEIRLGDRRPYAMAFSPDSKWFATAGEDGQVAVWESGEKRWGVKLPGGVHALAWAQDSRHLATGNANGTVYILRCP